MPYMVQFVGLVCFYRDSRGREALLPDGRTPPVGVESHVASIRVDPRSIDKSATRGWSEKEIERGVFSLIPCSIAMSGANGTHELDTTRHDGLLPQLRQIDPNFEIDPERADTIARIRIARGTLSAHCIPGGSAVVSQLVVPHDESVELVVTPRGGSDTRVIRLAPGTEVAITNMGQSGYVSGVAEDNHFQIYERLSVRPVSLQAPSVVFSVPRSRSQHVMFMRPGPIGLSTNCTNTGCC